MRQRLAGALAALFALACLPAGAATPAEATPTLALFTATEELSTSTATQSPVPAPTATPEPTSTSNRPGQWGRLANRGFGGERIKTTLFFAGQARDGSTRYGCWNASNLGLYTVHPDDCRHLNWSTSSSNREYALDRMGAAGLNVVAMSSWGESFLPCEIGWTISAPMQTAAGAHDELFAAAAGRHLLIVPYIESRADWAVRDEFPRTADGRVAPGLVSQVNDLIGRYLQNPVHPEWAERWARVYDRNGEGRYAVALIHASSNRLGVNDHAAFAAGFDLVAAEVEQATGVKVGFLIDPLPPGSNAPGVYRPGPEASGPFLAATDAILGIQAFIPEIWVAYPDDAQVIAWKRSFSSRWSATGIPFLSDVSPGYDASIVFPASITYGHTQEWRDGLAGIVGDYAQDGLAFNSWNGYTEAMAAVPTDEDGDTYYLWLIDLCGLVDALP
jgi:hypothetical protein